MNYEFKAYRSLRRWDPPIEYHLQLVESNQRSSFERATAEQRRRFHWRV